MAKRREYGRGYRQGPFREPEDAVQMKQEERPGVFGFENEHSDPTGFCEAADQGRLIQENPTRHHCRERRQECVFRCQG